MKRHEGSIIERAVKAVQFIHTHRTWTDYDLADHLGITRRPVVTYRNILCQHYPITTIREHIAKGPSSVPALYGMVED